MPLMVFGETRELFWKVKVGVESPAFLLLLSAVIVNGLAVTVSVSPT